MVPGVAPVARALGAGDDVPTSWAALQAYLAGMHSSGAIVVGDTARALAADVLSPQYAGLVAPARALNRVVTVGLLPPRVREQYGFAWGPRDARRLQQAIRLLRTCRRLTPTRLAQWPDARARR